MLILTTNASSSGGIGRRVGLKIQSGSTLGASSSLAWSKYKKDSLFGESFLFIKLLQKKEAFASFFKIVTICLKLLLF